MDAISDDKGAVDPQIVLDMAKRTAVTANNVKLAATAAVSKALQLLAEADAAIRHLSRVDAEIAKHRARAIADGTGATSKLPPDLIERRAQLRTAQQERDELTGAVAELQHSFANASAAYDRVLIEVKDAAHLVIGMEVSGDLSRLAELEVEASQLRQRILDYDAAFNGPAGHPHAMPGNMRLHLKQAIGGFPPMPQLPITPNRAGPAALHTRLAELMGRALPT